MLQVNCELLYVKLSEKRVFWITCFSDELLSNVKKIRSTVLTKTLNGRGGLCFGILAFVIYGLKSQEQAQKYLLGEVETQILKGEARKLWFWISTFCLFKQTKTNHL